ncbi:MAG TPA: DUF2339 domain-containing protein, partial [Chthoniobacterales bacterium]|nr:DUF2339 domain-containing protein [Chthoniobacterales bacterium]
METFLGCFIILLLAVLLVPLILSVTHARRLKALEETIQRLTARITLLEAQPRVSAPPTGAADVQATPAPEAAPRAAEPPRSRVVTPPPLPQAPPVIEPAATTPPPPPVPVTAAPAPARAPIDWESFLGVKLFAWVGGFLLFLVMVFFVKYAFENNLVTPALRVIIGMVAGSALVAAGWFTSQRNYRVPGQSLCATGVLVLYAAVFSAHAFYDLISLVSAFALMSLITIAAFLLAVRLDAQVVVVLGLIGGVMTPLLLRTGNRPLPTFGYVELINLGVAAVALRKRWDYLFLVAAIASFLLEALWIPFGDPGRLRAGFLIFLSLQAQFLAFAWFRQRMQPKEKWTTPAALIAAAGSLLFAFALLDVRALATRPGFFFGFTFLVDVGLLALALLRPNPSR